MRRTFLFAALLCTFTAFFGPVRAQPKEANADQITAAQLRDYLTFVASDEMEGRNTPSRGLDTTAKFIATLLSRWGAKPAGDDGTYYQRIVLSKDSIDQEKCGLDVAGKSYAYADDFLTGTSPGVATAAPLAYVGDGWMVRAKNIDDYQGVDVKGKIVVVNYGGRFALPRGLQRADLTGRAGEDYADPQVYAKQKGAVAIIFVVPEAALPDWERLRGPGARGGVFPEKFQTPAAAGLPVCYIKPKVAEALFKGEKTEVAGIYKSIADKTPIAGFAFSAEKKATLTAAVKSERAMTQNVVAIFEGSDPTLKGEYVALGAHYDHIGMNTRPGATGDIIYNGADDDGSGTVALISMAEAMSKTKRHPKRSTLFVWHCGEEKGLWGSRYFTMLPTVPIDKIITQLNIDMIGRSRSAGDTKPANRNLTGPNEVYVIGSKMMSTQLGALSEKVNGNYLKLEFNYKYDDPKDPNRFFFRSDHYNYAQKGIPIIFYFDGVHEDYHQLGDEVQKIDFAKMEKVTRTVYETLWELSESAKRPAVDKQLPAGLR